MSTENGTVWSGEQDRPAMGLSTVESTYDALKDDIISGKREPGELLRIDRMSRTYGIGPTPLRETLQRLTGEGLVLARGGRGFQVAPLTVEEFEDLNIARIAIEQAALRLSIEHASDEWEASVVAAGYIIGKWDSQLLSGASDDIDRWERANADFHAAILSGCRSRWLLRTREALASKCERYRRAVIAKAGSAVHKEIAREHKELLEAVLERDVERSCELLATHYRRTPRAVTQILLVPEPAKGG